MALQTGAVTHSVAPAGKSPDFCLKAMGNKRVGAFAPCFWAHRHPDPFWLRAKSPDRQVPTACLVFWQGS